MDKSIKKFLATPSVSKAKILDDRLVEVQAKDGEIFQIMSRIGRYINEDTQKYQLHIIELIFDECFNADKEKMADMIWRKLLLSGITFLGMSSGNRQGERVRIGSRIRQLREAKGMEARDLALLANIDAANLSRIEQGKYSVGIDILSRIAFVLGAHIDIIPNQI